MCPEWACRGVSPAEAGSGTSINLPYRGLTPTAKTNVALRAGEGRSAVGFRLSAVSYRLSAVSGRLSATGSERSAVGYRQ